MGTSLERFTRLHRLFGYMLICQWFAMLFTPPSASLVMLRELGGEAGYVMALIALGFSGVFCAYREQVTTEEFFTCSLTYLGYILMVSYVVITNPTLPIIAPPVLIGFWWKIALREINAPVTRPMLVMKRIGRTRLTGFLFLLIGISAFARPYYAIALASDVFGLSPLFFPLFIIFAGLYLMTLEHSGVMTSTVSAIPFVFIVVFVAIQQIAASGSLVIVPAYAFVPAYMMRIAIEHEQERNVFRELNANTRR